MVAHHEDGLGIHSSAPLAVEIHRYSTVLCPVLTCHDDGRGVSRQHVNHATQPTRGCVCPGGL